MNKSHQQQQSGKYKELMVKFRQAYPPSSSVLSNFVSYIKILGGHFINSLNTFYKMFETNLQTQQNSNKLDAQMKGQTEKGNQQKRTGKTLNFNEFNYDESQYQNNQQPQPSNTSFMKPLRAYRFNIDQIKDTSEGQNEKSQDLELFIKRIGTKKRKVNPVYQNDHNLVKTLMNQPLHVSKHWNEVLNQITLDCAEILYQERQLREKDLAKNQQNESVSQIYRKYLKKIGQDPQKNGRKQSSKRLGEMIKQRRDRVQRRPLKKKVHVQQDVPPIYRVDKVLQVLELQRQQFLKEKRMKFEQEERIRKQAERWQEQLELQRRLQQENRLRQQRQEQQRINKQRLQNQRQQSLASNNVAYGEEVANNIKSSSQLEVILQNEKQHIQNQIPQNGSRQRSIPLQQQQVQTSLIQKPIQLLISPPRQKQQPKEVFSTPPRKSDEQAQKEKNQILNKNESNQIDNPFLAKNTSPTKIPTLADLKPTNLFDRFPVKQPQHIPKVPTIFTNNKGQVVNVFNSMPLEAQNTPQPNMNQTFSPSFHTPNNTMNNSMQRNFMSLPQQNQPQFPFFNPPNNSMLNHQNSSVKSSNLNSSFSNSEMPSNFGQTNQILDVQSGPAGSINRPFTLGPFANNNNSEATKNLFAPNIPPQQISLFGISQQVSKDNPKSGGRRNKNQIRIS